MIAKEIRKKMIDKDINIKDVAKKIGKTPNNLSQQLARDNLREQDIIEILDAMDCYIVFDIRDKKKPERTEG